MAPGTFILRMALVAGLYVIVVVAATINPIPVALRGYFNFFNGLSAVALNVGLIAPILAIVGSVLVRRRRRFTALDWVSLAAGLLAVLFPALFIFAYSNCPGGVC